MTTENQQPLTLEFDFTREDLVEFQVYHFRTYDAIRNIRRRIPYGIILCLGVAFFCTNRFEQFEWPHFTLFSLVMLAFYFGALAFILFNRTFLRRHFNKCFQNDQNLSEGATTIILDPHEINSSNSEINSQIQWTTVEKLIETTEYYYLYISSRVALIIPKRVFADEMQERDFVELVRRYSE